LRSMAATLAEFAAVLTPAYPRHCEEPLRRSNPVLPSLWLSEFPLRFAPRNDG
jgi:hypothetical protein